MSHETRQSLEIEGSRPLTGGSDHNAESSNATVRQRVVDALKTVKADDSGERVRVADFRTMLACAQQHHIGRLNYWAVNRDRACGSGTDGDSCSGVTQQPYDYLKVFTQHTG